MKGNESFSQHVMLSQVFYTGQKCAPRSLDISVFPLKMVCRTFSLLNVTFSVEPASEMVGQIDFFLDFFSHVLYWTKVNFTYTYFFRFV